MVKCYAEYVFSMLNVRSSLSCFLSPSFSFPPSIPPLPPYLHLSLPPSLPLSFPPSLSPSLSNYIPPSLLRSTSRPSLLRCSSSLPPSPQANLKLHISFLVISTNGPITQDTMTYDLQSHPLYSQLLPTIAS